MEIQELFSIKNKIICDINKQYRKTLYNKATLFFSFITFFLFINSFFNR